MCSLFFPPVSGPPFQFYIGGFWKKTGRQFRPFVQSHLSVSCSWRPFACSRWHHHPQKKDAIWLGDVVDFDDICFHCVISLGTACGDSVFCCLGTASGDPCHFILYHRTMAPTVATLLHTWAHTYTFHLISTQHFCSVIELCTDICTCIHIC